MRLNWIHWVINRIMPLGIFVLLMSCAPNFLIHPPTPSATPTDASNPAAVSPADFIFTGTVTRQQLFTKNVAANLTFQLLPQDEGWEIWVGNPQISSDPADNFAMPVTPPFSGINARQIEGWHFRNLDNSGPNAAGEQNVNAPQELRPFCFVGNHKDFQSAVDAFAASLPAVVDAVAAKAFPLHSGTLVITNYTLGNLRPAQKAWIEEMTFTVTLNLDQPCDLS